MTFPLVPPEKGLDKRREGDERTRTAASVPTTQSRKAPHNRLNRLLIVGSVATLLVLLTGRAWDQQHAQAGLREGEPSAAGTAWARSSALNESVVSSATPHREPASPSRSLSVRAAIRQVFGDNPRALRVAWCESRLNARAVSPTNDWGVFQLHRPIWDPARNPRARPYWPRGKDWRHVYDPLVNARVAWAISKRGTDFWTHWRWSSRCWA